MVFLWNACPFTSSISQGNRRSQISGMVAFLPRSNPRWHRAQAYKSACNSIIGLFFCSRQMLPPQWVAWSRVYRSSFGISNSQGPSSLDLISLSPFDALKGAIQHSWWSIQPLFPSCSLSLMKCTLSIPEQQERNVQTHTSTPKHTKAHQSTPKHTKAHQSTPKHTTRWQVPGPKRHLSILCHAILSISSYPVYTYIFSGWARQIRELKTPLQTSVNCMLEPIFKTTPIGHHLQHDPCVRLCGGLSISVPASLFPVVRAGAVLVHKAQAVAAAQPETQWCGT